MSDDAAAGAARLETGWGPATPAGDNLVHTVVGDLADGFSHYARTLGGRDERRDDVSLSDLRSPEPLFNETVLLEPVLDPGARVLDEVDAFYGDDRQTGAIVWSAWPTPDLRARGWELVGHPPLMLLPSGAAHPAPPPADLSIEEVVDGPGVAAFEEILVKGFPLEPLTASEPGRLLDERILGGSFRAWVGRVEGRAVVASAAHVSHALTLVEWVATLPEARGRGYGAALTWRAASCETGRHAVLHSSDDGRSIYARMGFLSLFRFTLWLRPAPNRGTD